MTATVIWDEKRGSIHDVGQVRVERKEFQNIQRERENFAPSSARE
jgi:hypothetical protein